MKKLILSAVIVLFVNIAFANARVLDPVIEFSNADEELSQLLNSYPYFEGLEKELLVKVSIVLNDNNQIVVMGVDSKNEDVEKFIEYKLNYKKLASSELNKGTEYSFPVRFKIK